MTRNNVSKFLSV